MTAAVVEEKSLSDEAFFTEEERQIGLDPPGLFAMVTPFSLPTTASLLMHKAYVEKRRIEYFNHTLAKPFKGTYTGQALVS